MIASGGGSFRRPCYEYSPCDTVILHSIGFSYSLFEALVEKLLTYYVNTATCLEPQLIVNNISA
jgi:hypothetical protein